MREDWESWDTSQGGREWQQSEGVVLQLLRQGLSERVIRAILPVGGSRVARLKKKLESGSLAAKYFSIPKQYLKYYPNVPEAIASASTEESKETDSTVVGDCNPPSKRKPGRPRKLKDGTLRSSQPSILQFFSS
ncbi:hypothetical protein L916_12768 [Phytophthora nicotianae]|uniref:Uncharacterized protein n=2 Tax=Phytophthora nicotianae TaxID=4792 RepID=W2ILG3_PHYNI|nr:hypothetical protein L916_12768 [Phytophthora nicotianae]